MNEAIQPIKAIVADVVIEQETEIELNEFPFSTTSRDGEESQLYENARLNVKPWATVEVIIGAYIPEDDIDVNTIYLRHRNIDGRNGEKFKKRVGMK